MNFREISLIYFSPNGSTQRTLRKIAQGIDNSCETKEYDLTSFDARWEKYNFVHDDLVLVGMPAYGGRIPGNSIEFFRCLKADNTPAVFVVTCGNEAYGDALLELKNCCEEKGFFGIAAAAFSGEYSLTNQASAERLDHEEIKEQVFLGNKIKEKIMSLTNLDQEMPLKVTGRYPYIKRNETLVSPITSEKCDCCGLCARECPVCAINPANTKEIDGYRCLNCFRCVQNCPRKAKAVENRLLISTAEMKKAEIFI